jgi:xanthine dehydrogenase YagS FAD-binding subunit
MSPFTYISAATTEAALRAAAPDGRGMAQFVAGGTTLLDLMKLEVARPDRLVDINAVPLTTIAALPDGGLRIGALARMGDVAADPRVARDYGAVSQALLASASPQLRNMATMGGNVLQRTRCFYFRTVTLPCNKRQPGSGCPAIAGDHRMHAVLGTSEHCIATHASDLAVALAAFDATLQLQGPAGTRSVPLNAFYLLPGATPEQENVLLPGEMIVALDLPALPAARLSSYVKVRDRASFEFALVSAAVGLELGGGRIVAARIALGGVGTRPWRAGEAEARLSGQAASTANFRAAADLALRGARPLPQNGFKVELARRALERALHLAAGIEEAAA